MQSEKQMVMYLPLGVLGSVDIFIETIALGLPQPAFSSSTACKHSSRSHDLLVVVAIGSRFSVPTVQPENAPAKLPVFVAIAHHPFGFCPYRTKGDILEMISDVNRACEG